MPRYRKPPGWPKYLETRALKSGDVSYVWNPPSWAKCKGFSLRPETLGNDYAVAKARCDQLLNPTFDDWRNAENPSERLQSGTLLWLIHHFIQHKKYEALTDGSRVEHRTGLMLVAEHELRDGRRLGEIPLGNISTAVVDRLYEKLIQKPDGTTRNTTINKAMRATRRAWNIVGRQFPGTVPIANPFAKMDLKSSSRTNKAATRDQLWQFMGKADELGHASIGTAALIAFEWLLRETDIISRLSWTDYRPPERPDAVRLRHGKNRQTIWLPIIDPENNQLFPELIARLNETPRRGPLITMQDQPRRGSEQYMPYQRYWFSELSRKIRKASGLPDDVTFTAFRHGGLTELGDARIEDQGMMALSAHKTRSMLSIYSKRTEDQRIQAARNRLDYRTNKGQMSK